MPVYDAFISYSHARDKALAAALQSVMQKLGRPWYRRRALRIFRDDTSLSATPHLWPSIEQALDNSRYFILLASPESTASKWVNQELAYWLDHNSIDTVLIGLTDGELAWDEAAGGFTWREETPLPAILAHAFTAEPKWIDLRACRTGAAKGDARIIEFGADFAATVHGMRREDLLSQEVREQRRALALASSALVSLLALAAVAVWQRNIAVEQTAVAQAQRDRAIHAEQIATEQKSEAEIQRDNATRSFKLAKATANSLVVEIAQGLRDVEGMRADSTRAILETAKKAFEQLAASAPDDLDLQRSRGMMLLEFGNTYLTVGDLAAARESLNGSRIIFERLVAADPENSGWRRDLSLVWARTSKVIKAGGDLAAALEAYRTSLAIREYLVTLEPKNPDWRRDLALAQEGIGNLFEAQGDLAAALQAYRTGFAIRERLVADDPGHAGCRCELASSWRNIGNVLRLQGQLSEALDAFRASLIIVEDIVASDSKNADWQRDLALSHEGIGTVLEAQHNHDGALDAHRTALAIRERLVKSDPRNVQWKLDLLSAHWRLAELGDSAAVRWAFIVTTLRELKDENRLRPEQEYLLPAATERLAKLERR